MDTLYLVILFFTLRFTSLFLHVSLVQSDWSRKHTSLQLAIKHVKSDLDGVHRAAGTSNDITWKEKFCFSFIVEPTVSSVRRPYLQFLTKVD